MFKKDIEKWLLKHCIYNFVINDDLTVDVNDSIHLNNYNLKEIPFQFNEVKGYVFISGNDLGTCEGFPKIVHGHVNILNSQLYSLKGCPQYVYGDFNVNNNMITSLEDAPIYVDGAFLCKNNPISDLEKFICNFTGNFYHSTNFIREHQVFDYPKIRKFEKFYNHDVLKMNKKEISSILLACNLDTKLKKIN